MPNNATPAGPPASPRVFVAHPEHASAVATLLDAFNREFDTPTPELAVLERRFATLLARHDVIVVLARDGAADLGFAFVTLRPTPYYEEYLAQLEELYVVPALRDRGIGTLLIDLAIITAVHRGAEEMHINVDEVDVDTRRFYERHGFTNVEPGDDGRMLCYVREFS